VRWIFLFLLAKIVVSQQVAPALAGLQSDPDDHPERKIFESSLVKKLAGLSMTKGTLVWANIIFHKDGGARYVSLTIYNHDQGSDDSAFEDLDGKPANELINVELRTQHSLPVEAAAAALTEAARIALIKK